MGTKLVENLDDEIWRHFTGICKMRGILVGNALTDILKKFIEENGNKKS